MSRPYFKRNEDSSTPFSNYVFIAFLLGVLYLFYLVIRPFLTDLFVATVIAMIFYPLYKKFLKLFKGWKILSALLTILIVLLAFLIPVSLLSGVVTSQSLELYEKISKGLQDGSIKKAIDLKLVYFNLFFDRWLIDIQSLRLEEYVGKLLTTFSEFIYTEMTSLAKGVAGTLFDLIIVLFISFFLLIDGEKFLHEIKVLSPLEVTHHDRIILQLERTTKATLKGSIIVALTQGLLGGIGFWIFSIPSSAFWGVCMVFSSVIPLIGTSIIWIPAALYLAFTSSFWLALGLALWGTLIISGADNVLRPMLLKGAANLHPLLTFLSILGGLIYFGFLGFILGPIVLSFLMTLFDIYKNEFLTEG
ncbi:MAG: AI-2E family transporter [Thermodesulfobacteriota bacterium]|jgi:predicted PurR-regulated permease PerM